jgi:hypothetical protein
MKYSLAALLLAVFLTAGKAETPPQTPSTRTPVFSADFENITRLPSDWITDGAVGIDTKEAYKGSHSLVLSRTEPDADKPCDVTTPAFKTGPGLWIITGGIKPGLNSADSSFDGIVVLENLDASGKVINTITVADVFGRNGWNGLDGQFEIPKDTVSSRFHIQLNKTWGSLWVDELEVTYVGQVPHKYIDRLVFSTVALGNLLYPSDSRVVSLSVLAPEELPPDSRVVNFKICDYWGAEQMQPVKVPLAEAPKEGDNFAYQGSIDLASVPLEQGKYYEMIGEIPLPDKPFRNHSGLAIEPEAAANRYPPEVIPFSGRNWDGRIGTGFDLSHRIGIRIMNVWSGWTSNAKANPLYEPSAPGIDLIKKYHMGVIFGTPDGEIEHGTAHAGEYTDQVLRNGAKSMLDTYAKDIHPVYISLGNEPPVRPDLIPSDVKAYRAIYEAAKQWNLQVSVISTSIGPTEEFFKAGFGKYCDVYDFHCYESPASIAASLHKYDELFKKYGNPRPVWSTEIGLNSDGVSRHAVAIDMVKKFAIFFASGGANMSWFDLFYPDPDAKIAGSNGESFNVFDSRYVKYNPKITAIAYYDLVNTIANKKFVLQKQYDADIHAYLFRDTDGHDLEIVWKDAGRKDVFVPLPGVQKVEVVRLDGTHRELHANGRGVTLTMREDPLELLYDGAASLPDAYGDPSAALASMPTGLVRGGSVDVVVNLGATSPDAVNLVPPPFWPVTKRVGQGSVTFTTTAPEAGDVREAEMTVAIADATGGKTGELYMRIPVLPRISSQMSPVPPAAPDQLPAVKLVLKNNGTKTQDVKWAVTLPNQITLEKGSYEKHVPSQAHFSTEAKGQVSIDPGAAREIMLPLAGTDPLTVYHVRSEVADSSGETATRDRNVAGFVAVPKVAAPINLDGTLDESAWQKAPVNDINEERQYFSFDPEHVKWKGLSDLSGKLRFLWDDHYLYVGVEVVDDIAGARKDDNMLWDQDGLQFLVDPCRGLDESVGKYDYSVGIGKNGLRAWCDLTADPGAPNGVASDIKLSATRKGDGSGSITYEIAFPWSRLAPFKPRPGADLGLTMILNEDDGKGRQSFMGWFGNASSKQVDAVGDLILQP